MTDKVMINGVDVSEWTDEEVHYQLKHYSPRTIRQIAFDLYKQLKRKEQRIVELNKTIKAKEQECEELKERLNSRCFDPKSNNNRCISYNRIAEDYERDLKQLDQLKADINKKELIFAGIEVSNRELIKELNQLKAAKEQPEQKLELIRNFMLYEFSGENEWVKKQILQIIDEVK